MSCELLESLTLDRLKKRISLLDADERPTRKSDLIKLILKHMLSPRLEDYWQRLELLEQQAIAEALHNWNGQFFLQRFCKKYAAIPKIFVQEPYSYHPVSKSSPKTSVLLLFFYNGVIPDAFRDKLRSFVPEPTKDSIKVSSSNDILEYIMPDDDKASVRSLAMESVVNQDLPAILRLIDSGKINVSDKTGQATGASIKLIDAMLVDGDFYAESDDIQIPKYAGGSIRPIRPFAWPLLLQTGGLAKRSGRKLELTHKGRKALTGSLGDTIKVLYTRWRDKGTLDEFSRVDLIKGQNSKGRRMTKVSERRKIVEHVLSHCPKNEWVSADELFRYIQAGGFELKVAYDIWKLYLGDSNYGSLGYDDHHNFDIVQGRYLLAYLFEYLATLGMIDVAYVSPYRARDDFGDLCTGDDLHFLSRYDGLLHFKLNPLGAWCIDLTVSYTPFVADVLPLLRVSEQLDIDLIRDATPGELLTLDQYATLDSNGQRRFTSESLLEALEQGLAPESLLEFLETYSDEPLNNEVKQFFSEFCSRSAAMSDGGAARLINCGNAGLARMISTDPTTRTYCQLIKGNTLVVPAKSEVALRKNLKKLGYILPSEK